MPHSVTLYTTMESPIGQLILTGDRSHITGLLLPEDHGRRTSVDPLWIRADDAFGEAVAQLDAYFAGQLTRFALPIALSGTPFQMRVWRALQQIRYGETATYGQIAAQIGQPAAVRAVGLANGRNPIAIIVPCHRVVGAGGALTGYGGGLDRKRWLLDLEQRVVAAERSVATSATMEPALAGAGV
ncbi:MAG TPA: methylated-DNA--[protein]-cysteine S-methyltransferase [Chloroflexota bacterium]|nr:methylated-DNA--[protein]-cysteine S-methyltransferase [Chloroflexota bacterium]